MPLIVFYLHGVVGRRTRGCRSTGPVSGTGWCADPRALLLVEEILRVPTAGQSPSSVPAPCGGRRATHIGRDVTFGPVAHVARLCWCGYKRVHAVGEAADTEEHTKENSEERDTHPGRRCDT